MPQERDCLDQAQLSRESRHPPRQLRTRPKDSKLQRRASELDSQDAAWACDIFVLLVMGAAREDEVRRPSGRSGDGCRMQVDEFYKTFAGPTDRFPLLATHAAQVVAGDSDERFRSAVDGVIDGMLARAARR